MWGGGTKLYIKMEAYDAEIMELGIMHMYLKYYKINAIW